MTAMAAANFQLTLDSSIGKLAPSKHQQLCRLLNIHDIWKDLACVIENRTNTAPRFTPDDVLTFERHKDPASQLLNAWSTDYVTLRQLIDCLQSAGLLREASFIHGLLVEDVVAPPAEPQLARRAPAESRDRLHIAFALLKKWTRNFSDVPAHSGGCLLGQGGYADVFKGFDAETRRLVAVKRIKREAISGASHSPQQQFQNEINVLSSCDHDNVVKLLGYSTDGPFRCIVYEFMSNGSLEDRLACRQSKKPLAVTDRLQIARDAARGLAYLHSEKWKIHMDVKSANILLNESLTAKVSDYGITRADPASNAADKTWTLTNVIIGTTVYMAPEYLTSGRVSDKLDAYSYGVVLLELLTGLVAHDSQREDPSLVVHVQENCDENQITILDEQAGDWTITNTQRIYQTAEKLLSQNHRTRPRIVEILEEVESWCKDAKSAAA